MEETGGLAATTSEDEDLRQVHRALESNGPILLRGTKVVIPRALRKEMMQQLHEGHLGINKCKARARMLMYCPGMHAEIVNKIGKCTTRQRYAF